jgi:hypothetical protein
VFELTDLGVAGALIYTLVLFAGLWIAGVRLKRPRL